MKSCSRCYIEKDLIDFHISVREPCGYKSACKVCRNKKNREARLKIKLSKPEIIDPLMNPDIRSWAKLQ